MTKAKPSGQRTSTALKRCYQRRIRFRLLFLAMLYFWAVSAVGQSLDTEEADIRRLWSEFEERHRAHDAPGVAALYTDDADRITTNGVVARGRAEIEQAYRAAFAVRKSIPDVQPLRADYTVRFVRPDVALLDAVAAWDAETRFQFTVVLTKEDGRWMIAAGRPRGTLVE